MNLEQPAIEATAGHEIAGHEIVDPEAGGEAEAREVREARQRRGAAGIAPWLAWSLWALTMALFALSLSLSYARDPSSLMDQFLSNALGTPTLLAFATVGALVASRRPENPIGWIFCAAAFLVGFAVFAEEYARYALVARPGSLPGWLGMAWLSGWLLDVGFLLMFTFLLLLFPNGQLPSRRWRPVAWLVAGGIALLAALHAFKPGLLQKDTLPVNNPLGIEGVARAFELLWDPILLAIVVVSSVSMIMRFRQARGEQRQQLKWFAYAAVLVLAQFGVRTILSIYTGGPLPAELDSLLIIISVATFPIAAGIAILKYGLYNIDLLINRTLVYVPLTAILAGLYSASIALFQKLFVAMTGQESDAAIVITTLILASSFTPIKNSLQSTVDKRFKEAPDPTKTLRAFAEQVRSFVQLSSAQQISQRLLDEAVSSFGATCGAVYLGPEPGREPREPGRYELAHVCGEWNGDAHLSVPLKGQGEQFGLVSLGPRRSGLDYTPQDRQTLQETVDVVAQAIEVAARAR